MDQTQYDECVTALKRAVKSETPYAWSFCAKGADDEPVLFVGKREAEVKKAGKAARKDALDKKSGSGRVMMGGDGRLVFGLDEGTAPPVLIQKLIRLKLATNPALKAVKGLLVKAIVVEGEAFTSQMSAEVEAEEGAGVDLAALQARLDAARVRSKGAYEAAVARAGATHPDLLALKKLQEQGKAARTEALGAEGKAGAAEKFTLAISLYEELADSAAAAGMAVEEDEGAEDEGEEAAQEADPAELMRLFTDAIGAVGVQLDGLRKALMASGDPELKQIAEFGLGALTAGHRTRLQASLMEARGTSGDKRAAALAKVATNASAFLDHLEDQRFDAVDQNPFGVKVTVRKTLGGALRTLAVAA